MAENTETPIDLTMLKTALRIDISDDDDLLTSIYRNAQAYIVSAVSETATVADLEKYEQFNQASMLLAGHWYNARYAVQQTTSIKPNNDEIPFGVTSLLWQVRARYYHDMEAATDDNQSNEQPN